MYLPGDLHVEAFQNLSSSSDLDNHLSLYKPSTYGGPFIKEMLEHWTFLIEKQTKVVNHILEKKAKLLYVYSGHDTSIATTDDFLPQHYKSQPIILVTIC